MVLALSVKPKKRMYNTNLATDLYMMSFMAALFFISLLQKCRRLCQNL